MIATPKRRKPNRRPSHSVSGDRAIVYLRRSKDDAEGSIPVQRASVLAFAVARGFVVVSEAVDMESAYVDGGIGRAGYQRVMELARAGAIDHVIVWQFSRFGRDAGESLSRMKELGQLGVQLHSATEDLTNPLLTGILAVFAEDESRRISHRVTPKKRMLQAAGIHQGSAPPFGTVKANGKLAPGPDFPALRLAFDLAAAGSSTFVIADTLAERYGRRFDPSTVGRFLRNPAYIGILRGQLPTGYGTVPASWPAMIDHDTWQRAQANINRRQRPRRAGSGMPAMPLKALFVCGGCDKPMHTYRSPRQTAIGLVTYYYIRCNDGITCRNQDRADRAFAWLAEQLLLARFPPTFAPKLRAECLRWTEQQHDDGSIRRRTLAAERAALVTRRERADQGYLDGVYTASRAMEHKGNADARIAAIDVELAILPEATPLDVDGIVTALTAGEWHDFYASDPAEYARIAARLVERVMIMPHPGHRPNTDRRIMWRPLIISLRMLLE